VISRFLNGRVKLVAHGLKAIRAMSLGQLAAGRSRMKDWALVEEFPVEVVSTHSE